MEKKGPKQCCYCCRNGSSCICCSKPARAASTSSCLDLDAALQELGMLSSRPSGDERESLLRERQLRESRGWVEQSPPLWVSSPLPTASSGSSAPYSASQSLRVETEPNSKETPQQPPNSPVSPQFPFDQFRPRCVLPDVDISTQVFIDNYPHCFVCRESLNDPLPQRYEWDSRLMGGTSSSSSSNSSRKIGTNSQRVLSAPNMLDCYPERTRDRTSWKPYRIPRPKLVNSGHCSRVRTISATLHEEVDRFDHLLDTSQVAMAADALSSMALAESAAKSSVSFFFATQLVNSTGYFFLLFWFCFVFQDSAADCSVLNFPRSRSLENLERDIMDVAASSMLDSVSDKIEKLHV